MYPWIWRKLPFGLPGKIVGSLTLALSAAALLWFVVFPWIEPILLPFDDVQVGTESGVPGDFNPGQTPGPGASPSVEDEYHNPYDTHTNNPVPSPTR